MDRKETLAPELCWAGGEESEANSEEQPCIAPIAPQGEAFEGDIEGQNYRWVEGQKYAPDDNDFADLDEPVHPRDKRWRKSRIVCAILGAGVIGCLCYIIYKIIPGTPRIKLLEAVIWKLDLESSTKSIAMTILMSLESPNWFGDISVDEASYNASVFGVRIAGKDYKDTGLVLKPGKPLKGTIGSENDLNNASNSTIALLQEALINHKIPMEISIEITGMTGWKYTKREEWDRDVVVDIIET